MLSAIGIQVYLVEEVLFRPAGHPEEPKGGEGIQGQRRTTNLTQLNRTFLRHSVQAPAPAQPIAMSMDPRSW